jgi:hypothetical protein
MRRLHIHGVKEVRTQLPVGYIITEAAANEVKVVPNTHFSSWNEVRMYLSNIGAKTDEVNRAKHSLNACGHALVSIVNADAGSPLPATVEITPSE